MQTTEKKVITRVLGLTYAPCMDTYTNTKESLVCRWLGDDGKRVGVVSF